MKNTKENKGNHKLLAIAMLVILAALIISIPLMQQFSDSKGKFITDLTPGVVESNGTEHSLYIKDVQSGTYNYYVKCSDESGNATQDMPVTFSVNYGSGVQASTKASYTSSGGGGVVGPATTSNISKMTSKTFDHIPDSIGVYKLLLLSQDDLTNAILTIDAVEKPADLEKPSINVYKYLSIKVSNTTEKDIFKASISFKVEKKWIQINYIDKTKIYLYRYNEEWTKLTAILLKEDASYYYYQADSPGFSVFAVAGDIDSSALNNNEAVSLPVDSYSNTQDKQPESYQQPTTASPSTPFSIELIVGVVIVIIIVLVIVVFMRKRHVDQVASIMPSSS